MPFADDVLLYYTGLFGLPTRPAAGLEQLLTDFFDVPVAIEQFVGAWYPLERATQSELGDEFGASAQLGLGAVAGDEIWDRQSRARIRIGPLTRRQYDEFLPGGSAYEPLRALVRLYTNDMIDFEIQLVLARDEVPACELGGDDAASLPLGWCTWLRSAPLARDPDETILTL
jgi:type VI secretion system protein ImpH